MNDPIHDLQDRMSRLEAEVARLRQILGAGAPTLPPAAPAPRPAPPRPQAAAARLRIPGLDNPALLVAGAGGVIFLAGAVFFLRWSIQRGWVGPEARFLFALAGGALLSGLAARLLLGRGRRLGACVLPAGLGTLLFTFRWGALQGHFYPLGLGFAAAGVGVLLAGGLAARAGSGAALAVALAAGLAAPMVFNAGGHHEVALAAYLAVLMAAALAVPYTARVGARWRAARWLGAAGTWGLLAAACLPAPPASVPLLLVLVAGHFLLAGLWIWLPGQAEPAPAAPTSLWVLVSLACTSLGWSLWRTALWPSTWFAGPVLLLAGINLALVRPLRARLGSRQADLGLLALAAGHLALAVPVALAWAWVGPMWAVFALGLAWAADHAAARPGLAAEEAVSLRRLALGFAVLATLRWVVHLVELWEPAAPVLPVLNLNFLEGLLASLAWFLLTRRRGWVAGVAWIGLQGVGNLALAVELGRVARHAGGGERLASILMTLAWAGSGAGHWLAGLGETRPGPRRALAATGYAWLGLAAGKLLAVDLAEVETPLRALAFLGVGVIFLAAALWGNRRRPRSVP